MIRFKDANMAARATTAWFQWKLLIILWFELIQTFIWCIYQCCNYKYYCLHCFEAWAMGFKWLIYKRNICHKDMYGGNVTYIPVYIPTTFGLNRLKISRVIGHTLRCGRLQGIGRLLGQSLYITLLWNSPGNVSRYIFYINSKLCLGSDPFPFQTYTLIWYLYN